MVILGLFCIRVGFFVYLAKFPPDFAWVKNILWDAWKIGGGKREESTYNRYMLSNRYKTIPHII